MAQDPHSSDEPVRIRDAASVILFRREGDDTSILMGQRGRSAVFMPGKFVFPGGAVDPADFSEEGDIGLSSTCAARLAKEAAEGLPQALAQAALRELREETGLQVASAEALQFVFRAITPPGAPRRFDARFFLCPATAVEGDLDDFSQAEDELAHIQWVPLSAARSFDLPFITRVILAEIAATSPMGAPLDSVPFYDHRHMRGAIRAIV